MNPDPGHEHFLKDLPIFSTKEEFSNIFSMLSFMQIFNKKLFSNDFLKDNYQIVQHFFTSISVFQFFTLWDF